jgi:photosystem II stability/assembly factor-like uncharacterized protein
VYKTTDGGLTWLLYSVLLNENFFLNQIEFVSPLTGYAVGVAGGSTSYYGVVIKTTDGGINWTKMKYYGTDEFFSLHFISPSTGWVAGNLGKILKTEDAGLTWNEQYSTTIYPLYSIKFLSSSTGWAVGYLGTILATTDGGQNWIAQQSGTYNDLMSVNFFSDSDVWAVGRAGTILKTTNGGVTFIETSKQTSLSPYEFKLNQNYPNPFNPTTIINYSVPKQSNVTLIIYDALGREIAILVNEEKQPGSYEVEFQSAASSQQLASGIYFYQLKAGDYVETKKMILLK